ncbi:hypothetical protein CDAR_15191 [Caerostris darwini]|uniref:Secreted protein n=1 Tax=Caerostris darwini TaxID=1538125 RepID=A0AAV4QM91_9ARAC|nr:hypothetical protein CDAR_15191 [Caerostris darwini]
MRLRTLGLLRHAWGPWALVEAIWFLLSFEGPLLMLSSARKKQGGASPHNVTFIYISAHQKYLSSETLARVIYRTEVTQHERIQRGNGELLTSLLPVRFPSPAPAVFIVYLVRFCGCLSVIKGDNI